MELSKSKFGTKNYLVVASMLFGLFFGAGNLIFPLHLGQLAGGHWVPAALGFLVTAVVLPLLAVLAIAMTHSEGVYDIGKPLGAWFALTFMVLIHATIGPLFGTPRTATVPFTVGVAPMLSKGMQQTGLLVFSALFFLTAFLFSYKESKITAAVGKLLNPLFLLLLFVVFLIGFLNPMGNAMTQVATAEYQHAGFMNGFLQGYNTMDALAGLAFGVTVVTAVRGFGLKKDTAVAKVTAKSGVMATSLIGVVYLALIVLGSMSLGKFKVSADGGVAFNQVVTHYLGAAGHAFLAVLITVTCLTTAIGLIAAFAQDFHKHFSRVSYKQWLAFMSFASFCTANFGLDTIIQWSTPMLMFLYPFSMVLILLSVTGRLFNYDRVVYGFVVGFTTLPALMDMVASFPPVVSASAFGKAVVSFQQSYLPLASMGLGWLVPALVGLAFGLAVHFYKVHAGLGVSSGVMED
ncbi:branched-chain amino acid transport system II carrier protein [Lacticaseibacillus hulanensis]|uniref:branched-chain amino acid transport system II carrier protein n=1 Tax=Lacticaseibacillus hulanensis TaxID=2493111 RepID=UPI000FD7A868|nr:branched-chain amino acid transport system II carrier protein [Lacticaseibacillus hulanensis]